MHQAGLSDKHVWDKETCVSLSKAAVSKAESFRTNHEQRLSRGCLTPSPTRRTDDGRWGPRGLQAVPTHHLFL